MNHLRSNAIAYLALFLALGGGTAVAVSGALQAESVDGLSAARFAQRDTVPVDDVRVLDLAGMRVRYSCDPTGRRRGSNPKVELSLRTTTDDSIVLLRLTTGGDGSGTAFAASDADLDATESFDLDRGRSFGGGTVTLSRSTGRVVTLDYDFGAGSGPTCIAQGVALGG